jgi:protein-S-isoprenylcysteine O-methyltransferase Ste14
VPAPYWKRIAGGYMDVIDILTVVNLVIFYALFLGRTALLYRKGIKVCVIGTGAKKLPERTLENISLPVVAVWSVFVVITAFNIKLPVIMSNYLINISYMKYIGIIFCYIGLAVFLLALISFGKAWRIGIDETNSNNLVTTGIFRYTRNPIFLFMDLYFIGMALTYPNIIFTAMAVGMVIGIHLQIMREERFLLKKFGEEYRKYKKDTRRYI